MKRLTTLPPPTLPSGRTAARSNKPVGGAGGGDYPIRIAEYRKRSGLTQSALAKLLGITREHLCRIEKRRVFLTPMLERQISHHLNLSNEDQLIAFGYPRRPSSTNRDDDKEAGTGVAAPTDLETRRRARVARYRQ